MLMDTVWGYSSESVVYHQCEFSVVTRHHMRHCKMTMMTRIHSWLQHCRTSSLSPGPCSWSALLIHRWHCSWTRWTRCWSPCTQCYSIPTLLLLTHVPPHWSLWWSTRQLQSHQTPGCTHQTSCFWTWMGRHMACHCQLCSLLHWWHCSLTHQYVSWSSSADPSHWCTLQACLLSSHTLAHQMRWHQATLLCHWSWLQSVLHHCHHCRSQQQSQTCCQEMWSTWSPWHRSGYLSSLARMICSPGCPRCWPWQSGQCWGRLWNQISWQWCQTHSHPPWCHCSSGICLSPGQGDRLAPLCCCKTTPLSSSSAEQCHDQQICHSADQFCPTWGGSWWTPPPCCWQSWPLISWWCPGEVSHPQVPVWCRTRDILSDHSPGLTSAGISPDTRRAGSHWSSSSEQRRQHAERWWDCLHSRDEPRHLPTKQLQNYFIM